MSSSMRFHILGSAAGKTVPRPFCSCRVCQKARRDGGRDVRTRCSLHLYLDDEPQGRPRYAIDFGPDLASNLIKFGCSLDRLEHVLFTHAHYDHLDTSLLNIRPSILSDRAALPTLHLYGSAQVEERVTRACELERINATFQRLTPLERVEIGALSVSPLLAHHMSTARGAGGALHYVVEYGGKSVLLAWDTGWWSEDTWAALMHHRFDAVLSECTILGPAEINKEQQHLNFATLLAMRQRLAELGCIGPETPWATLHIGDNGGLTYDEAVDFALPHGITVGYDGMYLEV